MFDIKSFYEAKDVKDAVEALVREPEAEVISGGTDVLIRVREGKDAGRALVSIHNIKELKGVKILENGDLWIGAATAFSHITNDPTIQKLVPMLGEAVDMVGGPADAYLKGKTVSDKEAAAEFARLALTEVNPRSSWRASKEFRLQLIEELAKRGLAEAIRRAGGEENA